MTAIPLDSIPPLPYVAHEILLALNSDAANADSIGEALEREPGLTARVVSLANAAFFARQRAVYSTEEAVVRLGLNRVRVVAASLLLGQQFDPSRCPAFRPERYWTDAVSTAFATGRLAPHLEGDVPQDAAYLAGLLHNLGLLLLVHVFPREMDGALRAYQAADGEESLAALTRRAVGVDYHFAGRRLLIEWALPEEIAEVAGSIGAPRPSGPAADLARAVRFCALWSRNGFETTPELPAPAGPTARQLEQVAEQCRREAEQLQTFARLLAAD